MRMLKEISLDILTLFVLFRVRQNFAVKYLHLELSTGRFLVLHTITVMGCLISCVQIINKQRLVIISDFEGIYLSGRCISSCRF